MVHGVRLRDGNAEWYRNRYVQTPFIADPSLDILDPAAAMDMTASKANTHVVGHAGKILALEEGHFPYVLDGGLDTVGPTDFGGVLTGSFTAHPEDLPDHGRAARLRLRGRCRRTSATCGSRRTASSCRPRRSPSVARR